MVGARWQAATQARGRRYRPTCDEIAVMDKTGRELSFRDVRFAPGPGATSTTRAVIEGRNQRVLWQKPAIANRGSILAPFSDLNHRLTTP